MKTYRAVIFDWDGTLLDSTAHIVAALQAACADLQLPAPSAEEASWVIGLSIEQALYRLVPDLDYARLDTFVDSYRQHFYRQERQLRLFTGLDPFLRDLHGRGVLLGVATGKSRRGLDRAMAALDLRHVFQATRCADETQGKPDPAMLHELLAEFDIDPDEAVMVGDTTHDVLMAHNAGVDCLAVSYGAHPRATLIPSAPTALVSSAHDMQTWVRARI